MTILQNVRGKNGEKIAKSSKKKNNSSLKIYKNMGYI